MDEATQAHILEALTNMESAIQKLVRPQVNRDYQEAVPAIKEATPGFEAAMRKLREEWRK